MNGADRKPASLARAFATVGGLTMVSRLLGFARDILIARFLGAGVQAEAFFVAFRLPNLFRRLFAEGAFNMAFVPLYSERLETSGEPRARDFAEESISLLFACLMLVTLLGQAFMPWMVFAMAAGYADAPGKHELTIALSRITFPYLMFIALTACLSGVLNAHRAFAAAAAAPIVLNLFLIAAIWLAPWLPSGTGHALAAGVLAGGVAQFALVWWQAGRMGLRFRLRRPRLSPGTARLLRLSLPGIVAGGATQINIILGTLVASYFDGAVSWLSYSDRLYQLPLGVAGAAVGVALLPDLSRRFAAGDDAGARHALNRAAEFCLAIGVPASVALLLVGEPIVRVIYARGAFGEADVQGVAHATALFSLGLPAFLLVKAWAPLFFARQDTRTPMKCALWAIGTNILSLLVLKDYVGFLAVPLGTIAGGWLNFACLWFAARRYGRAAQVDARLARRFPKILLCAALMGLLLVLMARRLSAAFLDEWLRYPALAALIAAGLALYGAAGRIVGAFAFADLKALRKG